MKILLLILLFMPLIAPSGWAAGEVKTLPDSKVLAVQYNPDRHPHWGAVFGDLVDYYNGDKHDIAAMKIVFPQMGISHPDGREWIAIEFQGEAQPTDVVMTESLAGGRFYAAWHHGAYHHLAAAIPAAYQQLIAAGHAADESRPMRLLYWNSPDDKHPRELRTEILIPVK